MPTGPTVSVIIPAYNAEDFIETAVRSVLDQTERDLEVIVIDDASDDGTLKIVERIAASDQRVRILRNETNNGPSRARNLGIDGARGEWIALLDADDWYLPMRLQDLIALGKADDAEIVADNLYFVNREHTKPWRTLFQIGKGGTRNLSAAEFLKNDRFGHLGTFGLLQPVFRASFLSAHGISYDENIEYGEDFHFLMNCFLRSPRFILSSTPMYFYRTRRGSLSSGRSIEDLLEVQQINDKLAACFSGSGQQEICELLQRRSRAIEKYIRYRKVLDPMKNRRIWKATRTLITDLPITISLLNGIGRGALSRIQNKIIGNRRA